MFNAEDVNKVLPLNYSYSRAGYSWTVELEGVPRPITLIDIQGEGRDDTGDISFIFEIEGRYFRKRIRNVSHYGWDEDYWDGMDEVQGKEVICTEWSTI